MDWKTLFLSPEGRIGRQSFWVGWLVLLGVNVVLGWIPLIGQLLSLATIYCSVCIHSKRLHDMGKSAWLQIIPFAVGVAAVVLGVIFVGFAPLMSAVTGHTGDVVAGAAFGGLALMGLTMGLAVLISIGFTLWVGLTPTQPGENRFGPAPGVMTIA